MSIPAARTHAGFTLVEVTVVSVILAFSVAVLATTLTTVGELAPAAHDTELALQGARTAVEDLRACRFSDIVALYDEDASNDPAGVNVPGASFDVAGLAPLDDDPDGRVGRIFLPLDENGQLREDLIDRGLGLPRDLNGDAEVDGHDHIGDYEILPFRVEVRWSAKGRERSMEFYSAVAAR